MLIPKGGRRAAVAATLAGSGANVAIVSLQAIVLIPLYLHVLGPKLYGAWLASGDTLAWLQALDLGLPNLMIQRIGAAHAKHDREAVGQQFTTGLLILACTGVILGLGAFALAPLLPSWFGVDGPDAAILVTCFRVASVTTAFTIINNAVVGYSRGIQEPHQLVTATVIGSLVGFGVSLMMVLRGYGLWAIVFGLVSRAAIQLVASLAFMWARIAEGMLPHLRVRRSYLKEMASVAPATALGGVSYALANQSENAVIAFALRPELVPVYTLTKRAAEMLRTLLDSIGYASYGGFAHLVHSDQRQKSRIVFAELKNIRLACAIAAAAAFISVNASLVSVWVGKEMYGGLLLTVLFGLQLITVGSAYLVNYLYRATGPVGRGSMALVVEALARLPLMLALVKLVGLAGASLAAIATSTIAYAITNNWVERSLPDGARPPAGNWRLVSVRVAILVFAIAICSSLSVPSWVVVLTVGGSTGLLGVVVLLAADPSLANLRASGLVTARGFARTIQARVST